MIERIISRRTNRLARIAALGAAAGTWFLAGLAGAQTQAVVELAGSPDKKDPHPVTYYWEGENKPIYGAPVKFYTYFYTGTVSPDATVPVDTEIKRVAIPTDEWELNRRAVLTRFATFFEQAYNVAPQPGGNTVAFDENYNYVEVEQPQQGGPIDPRASAEWTFYYDQLVLWQFYCKRVLINDRDAEKASSSLEELEEASTRKALEARDDLGASVDEVMNAMKELKAGEEAAAPAAPAVEGAPEVAIEFNPDADYADAHHNDVFLEEFEKLADEREKTATTTFTEMLARIDAREDDMNRFQDWLKEKKIQLHEFASAWSKVHAGDTFFIDDIFYIVTKEPITEVPASTKQIIVRDVVTPQDLINRDGTIKKPPVE